jgi:hemerythrin-like domain-containing protein
MCGTKLDRLKPLREEHKVIVRQLGLVRASIKDSSPSSTKRLRGLIDDLGSRLEIHFIDEEKLLYKPLKQRLRKDSPTDEMLEEHKSIHRTFERLRSGSTQYEADRSRIGDLQLCLDSLQKELRGHLEKEEKVLFWLADLKL